MAFAYGLQCYVGSKSSFAITNRIFLCECKDFISYVIVKIILYCGINCLTVHSILLHEIILSYLSFTVHLLDFEKFLFLYI